MRRFWPRTLGRRLGSPEFWTAPFFAFMIPMYVITGYYFDAVRTQNFSPLWSLVGFVSFQIFTAAALLVRLTKKAKFWKTKLAPATHIGLILIVFTSKNLLVIPLAEFFGLETGIHWSERITGAVAMAIALPTFYAVLVGSRFEHAASIKKLASLREHQRAYVNQAPQLVEELKVSLEEQAREQILPRLDRIGELISSSRDWAVSELRLSVMQDVRPLTMALKLEADRLAKQPVVPVKRYRAAISFPDKFSLNRAIWPLTSWILILFSTAWMNQVIFGDQAMIVGLWVGGLVGPCLLLIKLIARTAKPTSSTFNFILFVSLSSGISIANAIALNSIQINFDTAWPVSILLFATSLMVFFGLAYAQSLEDGRNHLETEIESANRNLQKQIDSFRRHLWFARRDWIYLLHGTVMSSLTAIIGRLEKRTVPSPPDIMAAKQELAYLIQNLRSPSSSSVQWRIELQKLAHTWNGVCEVRIQIGQLEARALDKDDSLAKAVLEVSRELVSNAYRHSGSEYVDIELSISERQDMVLRSRHPLHRADSNIQPVGAGSTGFGSKLFDDLTSGWSMATDEKLGLFVFEALFKITAT
jgi:hypothetical protein